MELLEAVFNDDYTQPTELNFNEKLTTKLIKLTAKIVESGVYGINGSIQLSWFSQEFIIYTYCTKHDVSYKGFKIPFGTDFYKRTINLNNEEGLEEAISICEEVLKDPTAFRNKTATDWLSDQVEKAKSILKEVEERANALAEVTE